MSDPAPPKSGVRVAIAAGAAAVSTFLITILAARGLTKGTDASAYNEFIVFWSLLWCALGLMNGLQQESTRSVRAREVSGAGGGVRLSTVGLALGGLISVAVVLSGLLWGPRMLPFAPVSGVLAIGIGAASYAIYAVGVGCAGGLQDWRAYSTLMILDAIGRLGLVSVVVAAGGDLLALGLACAAPSLFTVAVLLSPRYRRFLTLRGDRSLLAALRAASYTMVSSAATVTLLTGYPALVSLVIPGADPAQQASVMTVVQLTRAPLMIPLVAFQGVAVSTFVSRAGSGLSALAKPVGLVLGVGAVGAPLAALVGPFLLRFLYGPTYAVAAGVFAALVLASASMALLTLTGTMALALGRHRAYAAGWLVALAAAIALLWLPISLPVAVAWSLGLGPLPGMVVHGVAIARSIAQARQDRDGDLAAPTSVV